MSQATDRLTYLLEQWTADQVFNETLITPTQQVELLQGLYKPDDYEVSHLNSMFRNTTYSFMRNIGYSSYNASYYSNYSINTLKEQWQTVTDLQLSLAQGSLDSQLKRSNKKVDYDTYSSLLNDRLESVRKGFARNKQNVKDIIEDYNSRVALFRGVEPDEVIE